MKQVEAFRISGNSWSILGAQNKDKGTALQMLCLKPGLNFVCDTGYKHSLHKDSKDGFKDMGFCCIFWGQGIFEGSYYFQSLYNP